MFLKLAVDSIMEGVAGVARPVDLGVLLSPDADIVWEDGVATCELRRSTPGLEANRDYFDRRDWAEAYLENCHRSDAFRDRWLALTGSWAGKVVIDIGCGPGNVNATLRQQAAFLVGVDVSKGALRLAREFGYVPVLADAQDLPFRAACADLVVMNAALHHCDDMEKALSEAARLVRPGGVLALDHDPQRSAWNFRGSGLALWKSRLLIYRVIRKGFHRSATEQEIALRSEVHHEAGDGVTNAFFKSVLEPLGFKVETFPHNHNVGAAALAGAIGRSSAKQRLGQRLSGIDPDSPAAAMSLMCRAVRVR